MTMDELLPNRAETAIRGEVLPDVSMKSSIADPSRSWLIVNRLVPTSYGVKIQALLEEARIALEEEDKVKK